MFGTPIYYSSSVLLAFLVLLTTTSTSQAQSLRGGTGNMTADDNSRRRLNVPTHYYSTSDASILGAANPDAALGNPMKGLLTSPEWTPNTEYTIPSTLEFYYIGMNSVMTGDNTFDWTKLDKTINEATYRNNHVIWRIYVDYPGWGAGALALPKYLIDAGVKLVPRGNEFSPQYDDPKLLVAFEQLIKAMGARYDGHKSIAFIQLGLLGKWGEWHTYPEEGLISGSTQDKLIEWYQTAFKTTKLQSRGITKTSIQMGMGLHDDSFAYSTLGSTSWFFWPQVESSKATDFWKKAVMGGETRPELQNEVFDPAYKPGSDMYKQDFMQCVETTHATYMFTHAAFINGGMQGDKLVNALNAHARMGYNFQVSNVAVAASSLNKGTVVVDVTVKQTGVAPFYYPLNLVLTCSGTKKVLPGVETLIDKGQSKVFSFVGIPANAACLNNIRMTLESPHAYAGRPIKFAQGKTGAVEFRLPVLDGTVPLPAPTPMVPRSTPTGAPIPRPSTAASDTAEKALFVNARFKSGARSAISDNTIVTSVKAFIPGVAGFKRNLFTSHRFARGEFSYTLSGFKADKTYIVTMGFAETYDPNCGVGKRVFNIVANGATLVSNLDVFAKVGCKKAYTINHTVSADSSGKITIRFIGVQENPFVSFIQVAPE